MIDKDRRVIAGDGSFEESFHISWRRGQDDLKSRIVPKHRLRAGGVLRGAAAAEAVKEMENHGHTGLPGRHGKSIGGFVADLWPAFEDETAGADVDNRPEACHRGAGSQTAEAEFRCAWPTSKQTATSRTL